MMNAIGQTEINGMIIADDRYDDDRHDDYRWNNRNRDYSPRNDRRPYKGHLYNDDRRRNDDRRNDDNRRYNYRRDENPRFKGARQRVETMQNLKMLGKWRMRKEKLVDQKYRIVIRVRKMVTMQINVQ